MRGIAASLLALLGSCTPSGDESSTRQHVDPETADANAKGSGDAEPPGDDPSWRALRIDETCRLHVARAPGTLDTGLDWVPCHDGTPACRELATVPAEDFASVGTQVYGAATQSGVVVAVGTFHPYASMQRFSVGPLDGAPFLVVEGPRNEHCELASVWLSGESAVVEVAHDFEDGYAARAYLAGPLREDPAWTRVAARLTRKDVPNFIQTAVFSIAGHVVVRDMGGAVRWSDGDRWHELAPYYAGPPCCDRPHEALEFPAASLDEQVLASHFGRGAARLREIPQGDSISGIASDGTRAVWVEGRRRDANNRHRRIELWAGDVEAGPRIVHARRRAVLRRTAMVEPLFGDGIVAVAHDETSSDLAVARLADGDLRVFSPPPGMDMQQVAWVGDEEIAVHVGGSIRRIEVDTLPRPHR